VRSSSPTLDDELAAPLAAIDPLTDAVAQG
jgi:hypothetical protein